MSVVIVPLGFSKKKIVLAKRKGEKHILIPTISGDFHFSPYILFLLLLVPILKTLPVLVPVVTYLTKIFYVANSPTVNADVSIKIILKKYLHF